MLVAQIGFAAHRSVLASSVGRCDPTHCTNYHQVPYFWLIHGINLSLAHIREHYKLIADPDSLEVLLRIVQQYDLPFKRLAGRCAMGVL